MPSLKYLGEALFFLGAAFGIARWTMRAAVESVPPLDGSAFDDLELPEMLPALVARGVAPPAELARMSSAERVALYYAVAEREEQGEERRRSGAEWSAACPGCGAPLGAGSVPIGFLTRCPRCGASVGVS